MIQVTAKSLRDYVLCPFLYKKRHIDGIEENGTGWSARDTITLEYNQAIRKAVAWVCSEAMGSGMPTLKQAMDRWASLWLKGVTKEMLLEVQDDPKANRNMFTNEAATTLGWFIKTVDSAPFAGVNEPFCIPVTQGIKASGTFDVVEVSRSGSVSGIRVFSTSATLRHGSEMWWHAMLGAMAIKHMYGTWPRVAVDGLKTRTHGDAHITDIDARIVHATCTRIETEQAYMPASNTFWCDRCVYEGKCWTMWKKEA